MYGKEVTSGPKDLTGKIQTRSERLIRNGVEPTAIHTGCPGSGHLIPVDLGEDRPLGPVRCGISDLVTNAHSKS
jgi:hypothetical protein